MNKYNIPLARPFFNDEDLSAIKEVLDSRWVAQGPTTSLFEREFAESMGTKHAVALNSATSGLHIGLVAMGITKGDDVLVSDFTFPASGNSILYAGAKAVPLDADLDTFSITAEEIERKITPNTRGIMPVYGLGNPPPMDEIMKVSKEHGLSVIEDSACAHGSSYRGKMAGAFGDIGVFSFHARKVMSTGEGGMAITDDREISDTLAALRSHGMVMGAFERTRSEGLILPEFSRLGYNYRMSDIMAGIGRVQLKRLEEYVEKRNILARIYNDMIEDHSIPVIPQKVLPRGRHNYQTYAVRIGSKKVRDGLIMELKKRGIGSTIGTYSLSLLPLFSGDTPNSQILFDTAIALPMFHELREEEGKMVMDEVRSILSH